MGFVVYVPQMPDTMNPKMETWLGYLKNLVGKPDKDCYFVGHSLGCITILRYLEVLKENEKIGGAVLVAGFLNSLGYEQIDTFFQQPISWKEISLHCNKFLAINSDNDPLVSLKQGEIFKKELNAELVVKHLGHLDEEAGVMELPAAFDALLRMSKKT